MVSAAMKQMQATEETKFHSSAKIFICNA